MKLYRLMGILTTLLQNERTTAPALAEKFEVSRRTINRDIETLCQAGIPVVTQQGIGGGISIADGYKLDKSVLTSDELSGLIAAIKGLGTVTEEKQAMYMLEKLSGKKDTVVSLRESMIIDLASHYKSALTEKIELMKRAIRENRFISFDYYYEKGECRRRIEPYFIVFQWTSWYVFGYCLERDDWRLFKLARLWDLRMCGEAFIPREIPPERMDLNANFHDGIRLKALFDPSVKYQLVETYGLNCFRETENGKLLAEIGFTNWEFMRSWILSFGTKVKVIEPEKMADEIRTTAKKILKQYEET